MRTSQLLGIIQFYLSPEGKRQRRLRELWDLADVQLTVTLTLPTKEMVTEFKNLTGEK